MKRIIDKLKIHNRIRVGYGTAFFLLLISYIVTFFANEKVLSQIKFVDGTNSTIIQLERVISYIKDGETGARGYAFTRDAKFLDPYYNSKAKVDSCFVVLTKQVNDTLQVKNLQQLHLLTDQKFAIIQNGIQLLQVHNFALTDTIRAEFERGRKVMEDIRELAGSMQSTENISLNTYRYTMQGHLDFLRNVIIVTLLLAFLLLIFGFLTYMRENKARREADEKVQQYQEQLKDRIMELRGVNKELLQMRSIEKFASTGRIARTIAHEVRNPLTNINLAMEQLKTEMPEQDDNGILFEMVHRNSNRINQLITDLLNSTKFAELSPVKIPVNTLMDEALDLAKDRILLYNISVNKQYSGELCEIKVDREKLKIAFLNIIVNAIEAMEPGKGILTVATRTENGKCLIEISDNGAGMDRESLGRLFEPYFTSKPKGNGLGLTNTQNIILNHKGTIQAESEKGKGTSFFITLDFAD